jgi:hypothetical protein
MNAVELFENLGVLNQVLWKSSVNGMTVRINQRLEGVLHVQVKLPFCGTWVEDGPWSVDAFLAIHKPVR